MSSSFMERVKAEMKRQMDPAQGRGYRKPPAYPAMLATTPASFKRAPDWDQPPQASLVPHFVYGYRSFGDNRNNQFVDARGRLVFHTAAITVMFDTDENKQSFFNGHDDDIWSLAIHPNGKIAATGQAGKKPEIFVWDMETGERVAKLVGFFERQVVSMDFSPDGKYLIGMGGDDYNSIAIYDWAKEQLIVQSRGDSNKMFHIKWDRHNPNTIVCTGNRSVRLFFFHPSPLQIVAKRAVFGKEPTQNVYSIGCHPDLGIVTGCQSGGVMIWNGGALKSIIPAHKGACHAVEVMVDGKVISGGDDGKIIVWDKKMSSKITELSLDGMKIKSIAVARKDMGDPNTFYVGCAGGETVKVHLNGTELISKTIMLAHRGMDNELWGLCAHPTVPHGFVTACDDGLVLIWDGEKNECVKKISVQGKARSCGVSPDGSLIAVGFSDGRVQLYESDGGELVWENRDRDMWISVVKFSPDGTKFAFGSHTNHIDVWSLSPRGMKKIGTCFGHSSYITHFDWSVNGKYIQSNAGDHQLLFWNIDNADKGLIERIAALPAMADIQWDRWSCKYGWMVEGIFPEGGDFGDVCCAAVSKDKTLVVTGNNDHYVKMFRCPAVGVGFQKPGYKSHAGHSQFVVKVVFTESDEYIISIGGLDKTIIQWKIVDRVVPKKVPAWAMSGNGIAAQLGLMQRRASMASLNASVPQLPSNPLAAKLVAKFNLMAATDSQDSLSRAPSIPDLRQEMSQHDIQRMVDTMSLGGHDDFMRRASAPADLNRKMSAIFNPADFRRASEPVKFGSSVGGASREKEKPAKEPFVQKKSMVFSSASGFVSNTAVTKHTPTWKSGGGASSRGMTPHPLGGGSGTQRSVSNSRSMGGGSVGGGGFSTRASVVGGGGGASARPSGRPQSAHAPTTRSASASARPMSAAPSTSHSHSHHTSRSSATARTSTSHRSSRSTSKGR